MILICYSSRWFRLARNFSSKLYQGFSCLSLSKSSPNSWQISVNYDKTGHLYWFSQTKLWAVRKWKIWRKLTFHIVFKYIDVLHTTWTMLESIISFLEGKMSNGAMMKGFQTPQNDVTITTCLWKIRRRPIRSVHEPWAKRACCDTKLVGCTLLCPHWLPSDMYDSEKNLMLLSIIDCLTSYQNTMDGFHRFYNSRKISCLITEIRQKRYMSIYIWKAWHMKSPIFITR